MTEKDRELPDPVDQSPVGDELVYTFEDLMAEAGADQTAPPPPEVVAMTHDEEVLSEQDLETYRGLLETYGPNDEIERILAEDKRSHGGVKRRRIAQCSTRIWVTTEPAPVSTPPPTAGSATIPANGSVVGSMATTISALPTFSIPDAAALAAAVASVRHKDSQQLRNMLEKIAGSLHPHAPTKKAHAEVRRWIWAINAMLTERDQIAPCVRAQPKLGVFVKPADFSDEQKVMLNDRQMFDLEYAHKHRWGKPTKKWEPLLRSDTFDPFLAARFIKTVGSPDKKIDALGLRDDEEMQLAVIRSEKVRKRWERIEKEAEGLEDELRGVGMMGTSKVPESHVTLWREEYIVLVVAKGSPAKAARLLQRFYGRMKPANQLANRKRDLAKKGFKVE